MQNADIVDNTLLQICETLRKKTRLFNAETCLHVMLAYTNNCVTLKQSDQMTLSRAIELFVQMLSFVFIIFRTAG